jgi:hypothetical protein
MPYGRNFAGLRRNTIAKPMSTLATGTFDVKLSPLPMDEQQTKSTLARLSIDKQFHGDLEATSKGEMLSAATAVKGSAGYVAMERVTGKLQGRQGAFVFQHTGTIDRGTAHLSVTVVPDSGTDELTGLTGTMSIRIDAGKHSYEFSYELP